jgi:hypothetical protein
MYDNLFKGIKVYKPAEGRNIVRILPPTWRGATHYGFPIWVHYNVGPKEGAYLCLRENKTSPHKNCPLCEELYNLGGRATTDDRKALLPTQSIIYYILDRNQPQNGVMLWRVSGTADSEIAAQSVNRRKGSVLNIVDPDRGYDLEFLRAGQKLATRYRGYQVVREDSPMTDDGRQYDEVLDYIFDTPLPNALNFYKPEHIEQVYSGKASDDDDDADADDDRGRDRGRGNGRDRDTDTRSTRARDREPPPDDDDDGDVDLGPIRDRREREAPAPRMRSRAPAPPPDDDDDDGDMTRAVERPRRSRLAQEIDDDIPETPRRAPRGRSRVVVDDDDDDEPPFDSAPTSGSRSPATNRARARDRDDDDGDDRRSRYQDRLRRTRD